MLNRAASHRHSYILCINIIYMHQQVHAMQVSDYGSPLVNYAVMGFAVFYGSFFASGSSQGSDASKVSLGTFYLIMVSSALTTVLDASKSLGELAGHSVRLCDFIRAMQNVQRQEPDAQKHSREAVCQHDGASLMHQHGAPRQPPKASVSQQPRQIRGCNMHMWYPVSHAGARSTQPFVASETALASACAQSDAGAVSHGMRCAAHEMQPVWGVPAAVTSAFGVTLPDELRDQALTVLKPVTGWLPGGFAIELSLHRVEGGRLRDMLANVFRGMPLLAPLTAICTFQAVNVAAMKYGQVCCMA